MLKPQLERLLVTPSCVTALSIMNQPPCGSAHAGTKSMPGVLFQQVNEGRATSAVRYPKGASAFILGIKVCFLFQMWSFANLLLLSGVSNLDLKKSRNLFSGFEPTAWNTSPLQNFKSNISIFSENRNSKIFLQCRLPPFETLYRKTPLKDSSYKKMLEVLFLFTEYFLKWCAFIQSKSTQNNV